MSAAPMVELGLFEFRARCRIQTESLIGKYRTWKNRPNDMTCQPWRIVIACLWMVAVIPAVGDRTSRWFTDGNAGVKLSPVDRAMSHSKRWLFVLVTLLVAVLGSGIGVAFDLSGWTLGLLVVTVLLFFGIDLLTPTFTVHHSDSFYTNIDFYRPPCPRRRGASDCRGYRPEWRHPQAAVEGPVGL